MQQLLNRYLPDEQRARERPAARAAVRRAVRRARSSRPRTCSGRRRPTRWRASIHRHPRPRTPSAATSSRSCTRGFAVVFFAIVGYYLFFHASDVVGRPRGAGGDPLDDLPVDHRDHRNRRADLALSGDVRRASARARLRSSRRSTGMSVILAMFIGALIAAAVGALLALPALRLGGIFLSLATLAFAFFFENVIVNFTWVGGGLLPVASAPAAARRRSTSARARTRRQQVLPVRARRADDRRASSSIWVRSGTTGRYLDAMRGSEVAAASIGINRNRARIVAFALSAAIAGSVAGCSLPTRAAVNSDAHYVPELGLVWIVLVVTLGSRTVEGAINAAIGFVFFQAVVLPTWMPWVGQPRAARVPHVFAAGRAAAHPVRPRCAHLRQASRGNPRVPEAKIARAGPAHDRQVQGRGRAGASDTAGSSDTPVTAATAGGSA